MAPSATTIVLQQALDATAKNISALPEESKSPFVERNLKQIFKDALTSVVGAHSLELSVKDTEHRVIFDEWPGVGGVDVVLLNADRSVHAFVELKWGRGTLFNCVWDVPKMSVAVAKEPIARAFLVAGAPAIEWSNVVPGAELFGDGEWSTWDDILVRHQKHWVFWKGDVKTHPVLLPKGIRTAHVGTSPLTYRSERWELRCVEASVSDAQWIEVESGTSRT